MSILQSKSAKIDASADNGQSACNSEHPSDLNFADGDDIHSLLQVVASGSSDVLMLTDNQGVFVFVSDTIIDMLGYLPDEIMNMGSVDVFLGSDCHPEQIAVQSGHNDQCFVTVTDCGGNLHELRVTMTNAPMAGGTYLYTCRDLTGSQMFHREPGEFHEQSTADIFLDRDMIVRRISPQAEIVLGVDSDGIIGQHLFSVVSALRGSVFERECRQALSKQSAGSFETSIGTLHQEAVYHISLKPVADGLAIYLHNAPRDTQLPGRSKQNTRRYQIIAEYIKDVFWVISPGPPEYVEYISPAYERIWGFSASDLYRDPDAWLGFIVDSDREQVVRQYEHFGQSGEDLDIEFRVYRADGAIRWVNMHGYVVRAENGDIEYTVGIARDITDRKETEIKLRMSEERYRSLLDHAHFGVFVFDGGGAFTYANKTTLRELGKLSPDDVIGRTLRDMFPKAYADRMMADYRRCIAAHQPVIMDEQYILDAGEGRLIQTHIQPILDENGEYTRVLAMAFDITDLKRTEEQYRTIIEGSNFIVTIVDYDGTFQFMNHFTARLFGDEPKNLVGKSMWELFPQEMADNQVTHVREAIDSGKTVYDLTETILENERRWVEAIILPTRDADGVCRQAMTIVHDITGRKAAEEALVTSEHRYRFLFNEMLEGFALHEVLFDKDGNAADCIYLEVNPAFEKLTGKKSQQLVGKRIRDIFPNIDQRIIDEYGKVAQTGKPVHFTHRHGDDGVLYEISVFRPQEGQFAVILRDITARVRAEEVTRESEKLLRKAQEMARLGNWRYEVATHRVIWSDEMYRLHGIDPGHTGRSSRLSFFLVHHDDRRQILRMFDDAIRNGTSFEYIYRTESSKGYLRYLQLHVQCEFNKNGTVRALSGTALDVTDQMHVQKALRESEEQYRALFKNGGAVGVILNPADGSIVDANDAAVAFYGYPYEVLLTKSVFDLNTAPQEKIRSLIDNTLRTRQARYELKHRRANGTIRDVELYVSPVILKGRAYLYSLIHDVTEQKQLEVQFAQAQRMETIGRLAGGVAHDFNNLLTVISGNAEIALMSIDSEHPLYEEINEIIASSARASNLTRQLLAFSRRQVIEPKVVMLNDILVDMNKMLCRLIGEEYQLTTILSDNLWQVYIDPGQVEQVVTNLVVNSRDAMPGGGTITIRTGNVTVGEDARVKYQAFEPGEYVTFTVTDTGMGIEESMLQYIFEPFFTTKDKGRGTGLGLSTCYGIVKQGQGHIMVDSMPGKGTSTTVYLPRFTGDCEVPSVRNEDDTCQNGNGERILVVEDDLNLNKMITKVLEDNGYTVVQAWNGAEALDILGSQGIDAIDLIITDVIMPRMGGAELVRTLRDLSADNKVLFVSGYTDQTIERSGVLDEYAEFLPKPFSPVALLKRVRAIIDR